MKTKIAEGWLATMDNQIDPTTGTVKLRANFDNRDGSLFPNQFVNARLLVEEKQGVTLIPTAAVQRNSQVTYVYLVKPDSTCHGAEHHDRHHGGGRCGSHLRPGPRRSGRDDGCRQAARRKQGQGAKARREEFTREFMSPSRIFILRPIATSLLMAGNPPGGRGGLQAVAGLSAAGGGLSHHPDHHFLSGGQPGCDGFVGHGSSGAPVRPGAGAPADDLHQLRRQLHHHLAVQPQPEYRRGGAGSAAVHQCGGNLPASRPSHATHLQQKQSCRCPGSDPGAHFQDAALAESRGPCGHAPGAEDFPVAGSGLGEHQRRPETRRADSGQSHLDGLLRPQPGRPAQRHRGRQRQPGERQL